MARGTGGPERRSAGRVAPAGAATTAAGELTIRRAAVEVMLAAARRALPNECCGLLIGDAARIERAVPARNLRPRPDRYLIDPADHCAALRAARAAGMEVVGAYHSHPDGTRLPSEVDCREASYPEFVYVIVAPEAGGHGRVAAFRLQRDAFEEIRLRVVS